MASSQQQLLPPPTVVDDTHKVYSIAIACIMLGIIASLVVLWRLGVRFYARAFGADDWAMIPALVSRYLDWNEATINRTFKLLYIGWTAMAAYVNLHAGVGKPLWEITVGEYSVWFKGLIGSTWLYPAMTTAIRVSILLFYDRIFSTPRSPIKWIIKILLALQAVYLVVYSILPAFICRPLYMAWHPLERQLYFNDWYYYYTQVALFSTSMTFDVILLVLPLYPVWKLQMPVKRRASISLLFMLGAAASTIAAWKLAIFVIEMARYTHINPKWLQYQMSTLIPPQFDTYGRTFWIPSQVEPTVALIGTSLPAIRQSLASAAQRVSKAWSEMSFTLSSRAKQGSGVGGSIAPWTPQRPKAGNGPVQKMKSESDDSELGLHTGYYEMRGESDDGSLR